MSKIIKETAKLKSLADRWKAAKEAERAANEARLAVEAEIIAQVGDQLEEAGTTHLGSLKVTTGFTETWNQDELEEIHSKWPHRKCPWPFRGEWRPNATAIRGLAELAPDLYERTQSALIRTPRKPGFALNGVSTNRDLKSR